MAQYGMNPFAFSTKFKVGRLTGKQAFSTWSRNETAKYIKEAERRMFRAAAFCRTDMRRGFGRRTVKKLGRNGYGWASSSPSAAGSAPRKSRKGRGKQGLQFVTFNQEKQFRFRIGSDMFPADGYGDQTNFHGDVMHNAGGNGIVLLPLHQDQMDNFSRGLAMTGKIPWPMVPKMCHYPKRNYLESPKKKTIKQFKTLFSRLNVRSGSLAR